MPATYFPCRWMVGTFHEILDSSSGNSARIKSMTDLRVLAFTGSTEAKYSSTELKLGDFSFLLLFSFFISILSDCLLSHTNHQPNLPRDEERDLTQDSRPISRQLICTEQYHNADDGEEYACIHPQSRKHHDRNEDIPNTVSVLLNFRSRTINVTEDRNGNDNVNPAQNRTLSSRTDH